MQKRHGYLRVGWENRCTKIGRHYFRPVSTLTGTSGTLVPAVCGTFAQGPRRKNLSAALTVFDYETRPAFLSVKNAPRFFIVLRPFADTRTVTFLPSSGRKTVFFWRLTWRRRLPVGLNLVARTRLEYPPPTCDFLPVMSHVFAICPRILQARAAKRKRLLYWAACRKVSRARKIHGEEVPSMKKKSG